jgi:hypothetical protein
MPTPGIRIIICYEESAATHAQPDGESAELFPYSYYLLLDDARALAH